MRLSGGNRKDPNINKSTVENITMPLPSLADQERFVARLKSQLAEADTLRASLEGRLEELARMPRVVLAEAFGV